MLKVNHFLNRPGQYSSKNEATAHIRDNRLS